MSLLSEITKQTIDFVYKETKRKKNQKRLRYIMNILVGNIISQIQPYIYTIVGILLIMFVMNCFQFFYYTKMFLVSQKDGCA